MYKKNPDASSKQKKKQQLKNPTLCIVTAQKLSARSK